MFSLFISNNLKSDFLFIITCPCEGFSKPKIISIKVLFPDADSPLIPTKSPLYKSKFTLFKIIFSVPG